MQRVFVTAGAGGIGREIVRAFAAAGAAVFTCDIDADGLDALVRELPSVKTGVCDVSQRADVERTVPFGIAALGGLDVLVNNAGIAGPTAPIDELDPLDWDNVVSVNLTGTFDVTRLCIPHLKQSPAGVIVTMSSVAGRLGYANRSPYCATKWALIGFTKTLAIELGRYGIRANAVLPGAVDGPRLQSVFEGRTKLSGRTLEDELKAALVHQSLRNLVDPRDVAALVLFLASDAAKSISGQALPIDGDMQKSS